MSDYPIPSYAAYIWVAGDKLWLGFPGTDESVRPHSVPFPANEVGMALAVDVLKARRTGDRMIGTKGAPCKHQVERELAQDRRYNDLLKAMAEAKATSAAEKADAEAFLEELGL